MYIPKLYDLIQIETLKMEIEIHYECRYIPKLYDVIQIETLKEGIKIHGRS